MELYDSDGSGSLEAAELDKASGIKAAMTQLDKDGDGAVSKSEISSRVSEWTSSKLGLSSLRCRVSQNGRPLSDATVTFEPEPIFDGAIKAGSAVTDANGIANPSLPEADLPNPLFGGLRVGFYKVKISKVVNGKETIPAKYNTETTLGQEIGPNAEGLGKDFLDYKLTN
ncbi:hypothetical protein [Aeoliella mucimassa]|nr:hypothetical protein [Aeoliella mucimassa]